MQSPVMEQIPLREDKHGVLRVADTRVTLDTVVAAFEAGATPEGIAEDYPLKLVDVYAIITYFLRHQDEVRGYLAHRQERANAVCREYMARSRQDGLRERLLARLSSGSDDELATVASL